MRDEEQIAECLAKMCQSGRDGQLRSRQSSDSRQLGRFVVNLLMPNGLFYLTHRTGLFSILRDVWLYYYYFHFYHYYYHFIILLFSLFLS